MFMMFPCFVCMEGYIVCVGWFFDIDDVVAFYHLHMQQLLN